MAPIIFVLGGARSGKSRFAEERARGFAATERIYIATAECRDEEMESRIALHRARRGDDWRTIEAPHRLAEALSTEARDDRAILVDCLTLWLTNCLLADADLDAEGDRLAAALVAADGPIVLVSNEVGLSIVPENALARRFRDEAGRLNQKIAALADEAWFVAAGLPLRLK
ncbi:bifunctional adenosylcobinamide kinase/adenosylcobinamide-phosphate guanylyltransferase [Pleomorphomonas diazotrophica]|uniref:Bifunctional adenosylcobalamin biosynthesis protein n=1 Tax=Pleomorphomonas diazotrophica TaxID=1166257 RepID=A0A1I4RK91_9HYPH|nr:bifunctional adenosylcobinamide kinase/adenosylcobinamide-phosphate guanylyltransferase [Pleomorphomonas diazotrophica]PKR87513.1 bifunctional adenosylcobinamide kinase/adenosylcobinamide-phosphate guanylyltransferase [Pleomorphomonas diazotrophica]SFM52675.1 adenosylcobinamide kinase /adenosylcobinamide-phosphate guanylyltransferase [Pleomorphomonas diazotrophica]